MRSKGVRFAPIYGRQAFKHRRHVQVLGRAHGRGLGRRPGTRRRAARGRGASGIDVGYQSRALELDARRRRRARRRDPARGQDHDDRRGQGRGARRGRLRGQCRDGARAISAPAGTSPRCAAPASTPATASGWRSISARCPTATGRDAMRSDGTATRPNSATSSVGDGFQKHSYPFGIMVNARRPALRRRGRRFPQLHLRQIWPRDSRAAGPVRLADLRSQGRRICCATNTASSSVTKVSADTLEALAGKLEDVDAAAFLDEVQRLQRRRATRRRLQSEHQGRPAHARPRGRQDQLGQCRSTRRRSRPTR